MINARLKDLCDSTGDTQDVLAEKSGVSLRTVSRWFSGEREPGADALRAIADAYNVSADWLLGRNTVSTTQDKISRETDTVNVFAQGYPTTLDELRAFIRGEVDGMVLRRQ